MEKITLDDYSTAQVVTSSFSLNIDRLLGAPKEILETDLCGLGWKFAVQFFRRLGPQIDLDIWFLPGLLNIVAVGNALVKVHIFPEHVAQGPLMATIAPKMNLAKAKFSVSFPDTPMPVFPDVTNPPAQKPTPPAQISMIPTTSPMSAPAASLAAFPDLQKVLQRSLQGFTKFDDVQFVLFSRRVNGHAVGVPQVLHANSELLRGHNAYLDKLLNGNIEEGGHMLASLDNMREAYVSAETYGYDSDSDLESEWDDDEAAKTDSLPIADTDSLSLSSLSSISAGDTVAKEEEKKTVIVKTTKTGASPGHVVHITDIASQTWKALLYYFYTQEIQLKMLSSYAKSQDKAASDDSESSMACSPKAMYRLAAKLDIGGLKELCKEKIRSSLDETNIVAEISSIFTSRYKEIEDMEIDLLLETHLWSHKTRQDLSVFMQSALEGRQTHSRKIFALILDRMSAYYAQKSDKFENLPSAVST